MDAIYVITLKRFFLFTAFIVTVTGCGSSGSTSNSPESSGTGSLAAKLIWNPPGARETAKTLYAAPTGVVEIQIIVSAADMQGTVSDSFPAAAGTGTLHGIPAGSGRTVTARGLDASGIIRYHGTATNVTIVTGQTAMTTIPLSAPVTTADPASGAYVSPRDVTLTASGPATIYYTTSGIEPTASSTTGTSPLHITITGTTTLMFFAIDAGFAQEQVKTEIYTITP